MEQPTSLEQFCEQAANLEGGPGQLWISQTDYTPEDAIISDEDTAGGVNMQIVRLLASTGRGAVYWAEPIYDSGELEQLNVELAALRGFSRTAVSEEELNAQKEAAGIQENSLQQETD